MCLRPKAQIWIWTEAEDVDEEDITQDPGRLLTGFEMLLLQGLDAQGLDISPSTYSNSSLVNLAGNAFAGPIAIAMLSTLMYVCETEGLSVDWATPM